MPEFQVVPETLVVRDSERILRESGYPRLNFNPGSNMVHTENRHGTDTLVPQDPLILGGGTISTGPSNLFVRNSSLTSPKELSFPIQESRKTAAAAATTLHKTSTVQQEVGTKVGTKVPPLKEGKMKSKIMRMYSLFCQVMQNPFRNKFGKSFLLKNRNFACFWGFIYLRLGDYIVIMEIN